MADCRAKCLRVWGLSQGILRKLDSTRFKMAIKGLLDIAGSRIVHVQRETDPSSVSAQGHVHSHPMHLPSR
jgi:hypothetical protein